MHIRRHVDRALAVERIPGRRIRGAEKLDLQAEPGERFFDAHPFDLAGGLPGGPAGGPPDHSNFADDLFVMIDVNPGRTEQFAIIPKAVLPCKRTSGGWTDRFA